jgi:hypothetical protein
LTPQPFMMPQVLRPSSPFAISLLEYAMLSAELQAAPDQAERTYAKYGLADPERRRAVHDDWTARLQTNAEERDEFHRAREHALRNWGRGFRGRE